MRRFAPCFEDRAKEALGSLVIPPTLHQNFAYGVDPVDGPPEIVDLSLNSDEHLAGVPMIAELTLPALEAPLIARAEFKAPTAARPSLGELRHEYRLIAKAA